MPESRSDGPIIRCLKLIRLLAEAEGYLSIKEVSGQMDLPPSTVHRLMRILQKEGFVEKSTATQRYCAGLDLERVGSLVASRRGLRDITKPYLQRVVDRCGEACMFVAYLPATSQVSVMAAVNSSHPLRYEIVLYEPHSLAWGATGRSILAFLPEEDQKAAAASAGASPVTGQALPAWPELKRELDGIRRRGYVETRSQKLEGAVGIGAPVHGAAGNVIGSFCITVPEVRFDEAAAPELAALVVQEANSYSQSVAGDFPSMWGRVEATRR